MKFLYSLASCSFMSSFLYIFLLFFLAHCLPISLPKRTLSLCLPLKQKPLITSSHQITFCILGLAFKAIHQLVPFYSTASFTAISLQSVSQSVMPRPTDQSSAPGIPGRCQCYQELPSHLAWKPRPHGAPALAWWIYFLSTGDIWVFLPPHLCSYSLSSSQGGHLQCPACLSPMNFWWSLPSASLNYGLSSTCLRTVSQIVGQPLAGRAIVLLEINTCVYRTSSRNIPWLIIHWLPSEAPPNRQVLTDMFLLSVSLYSQSASCSHLFFITSGHPPKLLSCEALSPPFTHPSHLHTSSSDNML